MAEIRYDFVTRAPTEAIIELYRAGGWWREDPTWRAIIPRMLQGSWCCLTATDHTGRLVGMGRVLSDGVSDAYIQDVVVLTEFRGRGIGRQLVSRLVARCRDAGIAWIGLVAEPGTQPFYLPLGFCPQTGFELLLLPEPSR